MASSCSYPTKFNAGCCIFPLPSPPHDAPIHNLCCTSTSHLNSSRIFKRFVANRGFPKGGAFCAMAKEQKPSSDNRMLFMYVFMTLGNAMAELGRLLMYEASRDWLSVLMIFGEIESPMGTASVEFINPRNPIAIIPILRAGLALAENASSILPAGGYKDVSFRLPERIPEGSKIFVVDPITRGADQVVSYVANARLCSLDGGTIVAVLCLLKEREADVKQIKVISAVAAPPALQKLNEKFSGLHVYAGIIDSEANVKGFIIAGLGDRCYGT